MDEHQSRYDVEDLYHADECADALHTLYSYLDGELTEERRRVIQQHLSQCSPCLSAFDFELELRAVVARSCREKVPAHLRSKIARAISEASRPERGNV